MGSKDAITGSLPSVPSFRTGALNARIVEPGTAARGIHKRQTQGQANGRERRAAQDRRFQERQGVDQSPTLNTSGALDCRDQVRRAHDRLGSSTQTGGLIDLDA